MPTSATTNDGPLTAARQRWPQRVAEMLLIVLVFFAVAGDPPPNVNETHYLCRLKHYWNPNWCAGDLFLESSDTQLLLIWLFGWVTKWLSLSATAWVGRVLAWTMLAWSWQRLSWRLAPGHLAAVLSAALFVTLNIVAHLAGEWVVGGVEAKCFAYGFVLLALRELVDRRWNRLWLFLGAATAFHPLVGGWSVLVCGVIWIFDRFRQQGEAAAETYSESTHRPSGGFAIPANFISMLPGLTGGFLLGLIGVLPALSLTWNESPAIVAEANRIYVFDRLPHHLALLSLSREELIPRLARHGVLLLALAMLARAVSGGPVQGIVQFAWGAAALAFAGLVIELAFSRDPLLAARLLRYYWYRLTDFAAPMAAALAVTSLIAAGISQHKRWAAWGLIAVLLILGLHITSLVRPRVLNPVPPADARMEDFEAWVEACQWIAENAPPDALFLTPRLNQSFKWRTGRPEVVIRKDIPQDAGNIVEWYRRLKDIYYEADAKDLANPIGSLSQLGSERVRESAQKYGADFVLTDRDQLLSLPVAYRNEEYIVYRIEKPTAAASR